VKRRTPRPARRLRNPVGPRGIDGRLWARSRSGLFVPHADRGIAAAAAPKPWKRLRSGLYVPADYKRPRPAWAKRGARG
jgi:hypothetical protein